MGTARANFLPNQPSRPKLSACVMSSMTCPVFAVGERAGAFAILIPKGKCFAIPRTWLASEGWLFHRLGETFGFARSPMGTCKRPAAMRADANSIATTHAGARSGTKPNMSE